MPHVSIPFLCSMPHVSIPFLCSMPRVSIPFLLACACVTADDGILDWSECEHGSAHFIFLRERKHTDRTAPFAPFLILLKARPAWFYPNILVLGERVGEGLTSAAAAAVHQPYPQPGCSVRKETPTLDWIQPAALFPGASVLALPSLGQEISRPSECAPEPPSRPGLNAISKGKARRQCLFT